MAFKGYEALAGRTVDYSRFTVLSEKTLLFLADFDGEFRAAHAESGEARWTGLTTDDVGGIAAPVVSVRRPPKLGKHRRLQLR